MQIRRAFAQGVSDHEKCAFDISPFHFFELFLKHLQSKPTQTAISEQFFETRAMDTNSNNISSSSYCFLFEKCAREGGCQGAPGHGHRDLFESRGHLFLGAIFGTAFSSKLVLNGTPNGIKNQRKSQKKQTWNEAHKTHRKCPNFGTIGLAKNVFSNGRVAKNH